MAFITNIPPFRGIVEYCVQDNNGQYHTVQLGRPSSTNPAIEPSNMPSLSDYQLYVFSRCPLDGFLLKNVPFDEIVPFIHFFKKSKDSIADFQKDYQNKTIQFRNFLSEEGIELENVRSPPKRQYPAYEPLISIIEFKPTSQKNAYWAATEFQRNRMCEYVAILEALGHNGQAPRSDHEIEWVERNSKVFRLENLAGEGSLKIGDIQYCPNGEHYWHLIRQKDKEERPFVRKFYVIQVAIDTPSLESKLRAIPVALCPDAQIGSNERECAPPLRAA